MSWLLFVLFGGLTLVGGFGLVVTRNVVHAALFMLLSLAAVAGIYLILLAEFLALVQVHLLWRHYHSHIICNNAYSQFRVSLHI